MCDLIVTERTAMLHSYRYRNAGNTHFAHITGEYCKNSPLNTRSGVGVLFLYTLYSRLRLFVHLVFSLGRRFGPLWVVVQLVF